eukprot:4208408-Karenia_brevis.AAC.1
MIKLGTILRANGTIKQTGIMYTIQLERRQGREAEKSGRATKEWEEEEKGGGKYAHEPMASRSCDEANPPKQGLSKTCRD